MALSNYANHLSEVGRHAEAVGPDEEAITHYTTLAMASPPAFAPRLAIALYNSTIRPAA